MEREYGVNGLGSPSNQITCMTFFILWDLNYQSKEIELILHKIYIVTQNVMYVSNFL